MENTYTHRYLEDAFQLFEKRPLAAFAAEVEIAREIY